MEHCGEEIPVIKRYDLMIECKCVPEVRTTLLENYDLVQNLQITIVPLTKPKKVRL